MKLFTTLAFAVTLLFNSSNAQNFHFRVNHLDMSDGLSFRHATCVVQDKQGYIWIGTRNGLNRYDGYEFVHFTSNGGKNKPSLSGNYIHDLDIDSDGKIWIATNHGLDVLNTSNYTIESFTPQTVFNNKKGIKSIDEITITKGSKRIFIHSHQYQRIDRFYNTVEFKNNAFEEVEFTDDGQSYEYIANVFEDDKMNLWLRPAFSKTFYNLNDNLSVKAKITLPDSIGKHSLKATTSPTKEQQKQSGPYNRNMEFIRSQTGDINLVGSFNNSHETFMIRGKLDGEFTEILGNIGLTGAQMPVNDFIDRDGDLWLMHDMGIVVQSKEHINYISADLIDLKDNSVTYFYQSRDGTVWITTNFGVYRVRKEVNPFKYYLNTKQNDQGYGRSMRAIEAGSHNIIYSTVFSDGIWEFNRSTGKERQLIPANFETEAKTYSILPYAMHYQDSVLWLCNWFDEGILKLSLSPLNLDHIHCKDNKDGFARSMISDEKGRLWLGTDHGINILDIKSESLVRFEPENDFPLLRDLDISALLLAESGEIWVGTREHGVFRISKNNRFEKIISKADGLSSNTVLSLHESDDVLWIGTSSGLNKLKLSDKSNKIYDETYGMPNNQINGIKAKGQYLWISTNKGLCRFNIMKETAISYYEEDGLVHEEFNYSSSLDLDDGSILFGGMNGVTEINTDSIVTPKSNLQIVLTGFQKSGTSSLSDLINLNDIIKNGITLDHNDKSFNLKFAYTDLFSSKHIKYKYILEGYDNEWTLLGSENNVRFNKLPAGEYTFRVKALGNDGQWSDTELSIPIHVIQVFYKTWWFISLILLLISSIIYGVILYRKRQKEKLATLRLKIASDLHDDVGGVIAQIGIQAELIKEGVYDENQKSHEINSIAHNSREAVQAMSDVLWTIDTRAEKMLDLVARMRSYAYERLSSKNIEILFTTNDLEDKQLDLNFRQNIYRAFKEIINNILKHSNATKVKIHIEKNKKFILTVEDNGSNVPSTKAPGQGLKNIQMRAERINGKVEINRAKGYKVTLTV